MDCENQDPTNSDKIERLLVILESIKSKLNSIDDTSSDGGSKNER
jgi:hypothetical protein